MSVMQTGTFLALKYGTQAMSTTSSNKPKSKGNIEVTSKCSTLGGAFADMAYIAANGCNDLVRSDAVQLSSSNIRVDAVAPSPATISIFTTSKLAEVGVEYQLKKTAEEIRNESAGIYQGFGLGEDETYYYNRSAAPGEIANVAVFLASDLPMAINGQAIVADSGKSVAASGDTSTGPVLPMSPFIL
ncbi:hypothetical protein N7537_001409 [Penicillium hordei]|uniref:Uncharacterized protein n=1 Tax=Penicillium hordei TaxID=40994 RepID=A0AAD6EFF7_9EURO|nr:uncharacterized protein N7537_001409 [Penicillium hordei]KAJ5616295.1 hypothetical protein N7537_001409 [Penicillium hordei]